MPNWKGHLIFGFLFFITLILFNVFIYNFLNVPAWYWWLIYSPLLIMMALFPDIDTPASKIRWIWAVVGLSLIIFFSLEMALKGLNLWHLIYIIIIAALLLVPFFMTHRGIMHSLGMGVIIALTLLLIGSWQLFFIGLLAYWSHLLIDFIYGFVEHGHAKIRVI